jgi:hypothetical protein
MKVRFSLRGALILLTAVGLLLGYSQWRRNFILSQVDSLKAEGVELEAPHTWRDLVWQRPPASAYDWAYSKQIEERLDNLGVKEYRHWITY